MSIFRWIAVPGGRVETLADGTSRVAVLRVLMAPRLDEQLVGTKMEDWPATINEATPVVEVKTPAGVQALTGVTVRRLAQSEVWRGFFGHGITVNPWRPGTGRDAPKVRDTLARYQSVETVYAQVAKHPRNADVVAEQLTTWTPPPQPSITPLGEPTFAKVDFHHAVALLREHPHVLKMLGLIVEIELKSASVPRADAPSQARVRVRWDQSPIPIESPWTAYEYDETMFLPASSSTGDVKSGMVDLDDQEKWDVIKVDVDGAVGKLRQAKGAIRGTDVDSIESTMLPTLKSAGLQLARKNRDAILKERTERGNANLATGGDVDRDLFADDLVLGYRIDILPQLGPDESQSWFSLHTRSASYTVDGKPIGAEKFVEEGHIKPHAAVLDAGGLRTDQIVARWMGWSLAVPRPSVGNMPGVPKPAAAQLIPYQFTADFSEVPDTLPELRFGTAYQMRARVVDVAGGGLDLDDARAEGAATDLVTYVRWEPVPPPEIPLPAETFIPDPEHPGGMRADPDFYGPGGNANCLVVRSAAANNGFSVTEFENNPAYPANQSRTLIPPVTTIELADQHGAFSVDQTRSDELAVRAGLITGISELPDPMALGVAAAVLKQPGGLDDDTFESRTWAGTWPDMDPKRIELVAGDGDDDIALQWVPFDSVAGGEEPRWPAVRVTVPAGQRVTVELSSTILQDRLDWFALKLLTESDDPDSEADVAAVNGRHPLLSPPRRLECVHAVRKPLNAPTGSLSASRPAGATYADLEPDDAILGIHTQSTAQLEIRAEWKEWGDAKEPTDATTALPPLAVSYGATELPAIRHEFGDTKHRMVQYWATAVSRYRDCFASSDPTTDEDFRVDGELQPELVSVKSSARPAPPSVIAMVPAFSWTDAVRSGGGLMRTRSAGRLRIELGHPWYTTGEGECIAVLLWPGAESSIPHEVRPRVSWLNRDPIHPTSTLKALAEESLFTNALDAVDVPLVETGTVVRALPYPVFLEDGRWFADIEIPGAAAASYCPFVRLALARFQRESLDGLSLSTVAQTDMVPVMPDRMLDVHRDADGLHVTLSGRSREGERPNRVTATLERCAQGTVTESVELASLTTVAPDFPVWTRVPNAVVSGSTNESLPPLALPETDDPMRVLIREVEDIDGPGNVQLNTAEELTERPVYLDIVSLPLAQ